MSSRRRKKLVTDVAPEILDAVRDLAKAEGLSLELLVDEALADLIKKRQDNPRQHVMAAYQSSHTVFEPLYQKLAKAEDIMDRYGHTLNALGK